MRNFLLILFFFSFVVAPLAPAQQRAVIDDPDGYVNVRAEKNAQSEVTATVKMNEPFTFEQDGDDEWSKVTLASGKVGWMYLSRIKLFFTDKDLPSLEKDPAGPSEIDQFARGRGFRYAAGTRRAARGDAGALKQFFLIAQDADGAAAESVQGIPTVIFHLLGDDKFAKFLAAQPRPYRMMVRNLILRDGLIPPASLYLRRHFPETTRALFGREVVDWFSPNKLYAIRKVFSDEFELGGSKVVRAELIDQKSGRVLCDLSGDDIGAGAEREGEALWSPDSKRVACLSTDQTVEQGNLFSTPPPAPLLKQTAVYQLAGESFARVDLSLKDAPGRESDAELERAVLGHKYTEPTRWLKPNVLLLERHEYYRVIKPTQVDNLKFDSIHDLARRYQITVTIEPDGKATAVWKLRKDS